MSERDLLNAGAARETVLRLVDEALTDLRSWGGANSVMHTKLTAIRYAAVRMPVPAAAPSSCQAPPLHVQADSDQAAAHFVAEYMRQSCPEYRKEGVEELARMLNAAWQEGAAARSAAPSNDDVHRAWEVAKQWWTDEFAGEVATEFAKLIADVRRETIEVCTKKTRSDS